MKLRENYDEMSDKQLVEEIDRRCEAFGDQLPTYVDGEFHVLFRGRRYYYDQSDETGIHIRVNGIDRKPRLVSVSSKDYRPTLLAFLQHGKFTYYRNCVEAETETQEKALADIQEETMSKHLDEFHEFLVEDQLHDIEAKIEWVKDRLISQMTSLKETLEREITSLKQDEKHVPNSLGVLQGNAGQLDILCMEYYQLKEQQSRVSRMIRRYEKASQQG